MRDYHSVSGLRPGRHDHDEEEEPELQWLEDSINYLAAITFICIGAICTAVARGVVRAYQSYTNSKNSSDT